MACRIHNLGKHRLALDLWGGKVIYVEPNQISPPLREEMLYDNVHLPKWLEQGLARKIHIKMAEVLEYEEAEVRSREKAAKQAAVAEEAENEEDAAETGKKKHTARHGKTADAIKSARHKHSRR